jgi:phosphoribosyl-ATP pyrophosphohydrolase
MKAVAKKVGAKKVGAKKAAPKKNGAKKQPRKLHPPAPAPFLDETGEVLDRLYAVIATRRDTDPALSHSARLLSRGPAKVAQKFGEEAVEAVIEGAAGNREALIAESADVLYHLLVLWISAGVEPVDVWAELRRREGVSGLAEKAARRLLPALGTRKIP